jgi:hypothetical protein
MTPASPGTSKPRLGTTWDDFRRPRRPRRIRRAATLSLISRSKPGRRGRSNRVLGRLQTSQTSPSGPVDSPSEAAQLIAVQHTSSSGTFQRRPGTFYRRFKASQNVPDHQWSNIDIPDLIAAKKIRRGGDGFMAVAMSYCLESQPTVNGPEIVSQSADRPIAMGCVWLSVSRSPYLGES